MAVTAVPDPEPAGLESLTAAEAAMAERKAGQSIATLGNEKHPQVNLMGALGWVLHQRTHPGDRLTFEAYMKSRTFNDIATELGLGDDDEAEDDSADEAEGKDDDATSTE